MNKKCDTCKKWDGLCELSGQTRKTCMKMDYAFYEAKDERAKDWLAEHYERFLKEVTK